jgi:hypothetical protein
MAEYFPDACMSVRRITADASGGALWAPPRVSRTPPARLCVYA